MTQIALSVSPGIIIDSEEDCPFNHDLPEPPEVENDIVGLGTTLRSRMKAAKSTLLYQEVSKQYPLVEKDKILNPSDTEGNALFYKKGSKRPKLIKIEIADKTHEYPISSAAHHCIPAQESLKDHAVLAFMCKRRTSEKKNHGYADGQVWSNIGFDVNGLENGVYLPGSYAVGGGRGGTKDWTKDMPDKEEEDIADTEDENSSLLTGMLNQISNSNRKWLYVKNAVKIGEGGQFHDRHVDYSTVYIKSQLDKVLELYISKYTQSFLAYECSKCEDRFKKADEFGIPTPYNLVLRLNKISTNARRYLSGNNWAINVYTSKWGEAYMKAVLANNPDAK